MNKYLIVTIIVLLTVIGAGWQQLSSVNEKWKIAEANVKAYSEELSVKDKKNTALQLTVDQLEYFNDSVLQALDDTRKELKIKDKNLKALQTVKSGFTKRDTITITQVDTLFREPTLAIDTLIGDDWYNEPVVYVDYKKSVVVTDNDGAINYYYVTNPDESKSNYFDENYSKYSFLY